MIFMAGVHGVGKTYVCHQLKQNMIVYSASELIEQYGKIRYNGYKKVFDIEDNQNYLVDAVKQIGKQGNEFILDGHFCLFNSDGDVEKIPYVVFKKLCIEGIILLCDKAEIIQRNVQKREGGLDRLELQKISEIQEQEIEHAKNVSQELNIPLAIINTSDKDAISKCRQFIATLWRSGR